MKRLIPLLALLAIGGATAAFWDREDPKQRSCAEVDFDADRFIVCTVDANTIRLRANGADGKAVRSFARLEEALGDDVGDMIFAMNAGMFDHKGAPIGLFIEDGIERHAVNRNEGSGNFHMMPNGVFLIDDEGARVVTTGNYRDEWTPRAATQSGPMLLIDGHMHPRFEPDGTSRHVRNGIGVRADGKVLVALSRGDVSLGKFARLFRDRLRAPNALYLDGSISGIWVPELDLTYERRKMGPMLYATKATTPAASAPGP